jgi:hypothetical protein
MNNFSLRRASTIILGVGEGISDFPLLSKKTNMAITETFSSNLFSLTGPISSQNYTPSGPRHILGIMNYASRICLIQLCHLNGMNFFSLIFYENHLYSTLYISSIL